MGLEGTIHLASGSIAVTDEIVQPNSVSISMSTCRENRFDFGTFNAAELKMGIISEDAREYDFVNAVVQLSEVYEDEEGDEVSNDLGEYKIDATTVKRTGNVIKFSAYDAALDFDVELPDSVRDTSYTALTAIQAACTACGVNLDGSLPSGSPNEAVTFKLSSAAVQTWRDVVMWACQLICANAVINRAGLLEIRQAWYEFNASGVFTCTAKDRISIKFSDKRSYLKYLTAYSGTKIKTYTTAQDAPSQSVAGEMTLSKNPLLDDKTEAECDVINQAVADKPLVQRQITAKLFSDVGAGVSLGDICTFSGGNVDVRHSVRGKMTGVTWRYNGITTVVSTALASAK